ASLGESPSLLSADVVLSTHIADVSALSERERLSEVVLVGHNCGGMVITGTVDHVPDRIGHLVYLYTFVPRDGDSMQSVAPIVVGVFRIEARLHGDGWRVDPPTREDFGVSQEPDRSWVRRSLTAQSLQSCVEPLRLTYSEIVSRFRRTHISCAGRGHLVSLLQRTFM